MPEAVKEINALLTDLSEEDYAVVIDYVRLLAENRKRQRKLETLAAMNEFGAVLGNDKGWSSEEDMLADMVQVYA